MALIDVVWLSYHEPDIIARGYWDQMMLEDFFSGDLWRPARSHEYRHYNSVDDVLRGAGAVVIIPARHHVRDIKRINADLNRLSWCLVLLTGDEQGLFPWQELCHPAMKIWLMTPPADIRQRGFTGGILPNGYSLNWRDLSKHSHEVEREVFFAGQNNHEERTRCIDATRLIDKSYTYDTEGFTQGLTRDNYADELARSRSVVCPGGAFTPDTFRLYETLEANRMPIVKDLSYFEKVFGEIPPIGYVPEWSESCLRFTVERIQLEWPSNINYTSAWWMNWKRKWAYQLHDDIKDLSGLGGDSLSPSDEITVLIPTSPIPSHPSIDIICETISSIRAYPELSHCEIILMIDGVRFEQYERYGAYQEYIFNLLEWCRGQNNILPIIHHEHLHQAEMTRRALHLVKTPLVLFVEHDTPVIGEIPWADIVRTMDGFYRVNLVRFSHEAVIQPEHRYLMIGEPNIFGTVPLLATAQWSQRPHLARTEFYRWMIQTYFSSAARTMIEDVMHGVLATSYREQHYQGWERFNTYIYHPGGGIKRSDNLDGRREDPKYDMIFAYPGEPPLGAPQP